ncbi:MAG TPA: DCC1-like thiol-disulfide oxidoreductase family protein [Bacteroidia bacterium]|nr:DCC1-like thiol-disulfide oxidoreductase family protein [Bacteroidia bacterium]
MKTLENHTMVYDADCPLCMAYTNAFVSTKMLDKEGRIPYQQVGGEFCPGMDAERAKNEIALVNRETGEVKYGLDSLLTILEMRFRWIGKVARIQPLNFFIQKFYNFISYNRKVIMPAPPRTSGMYDCTPTFKLKYRLAYIAAVWLITSLVLVKYSTLLTGFIPETNFTREFLICGGQVVFQLLAVGFFAKGKIMDYLGNMMTVSLIGALLLLPAFIIGSILTGLPAEVFIAYFMGVVGFMLYEHARRMKILELGWWPSVSWVLYRMIVLGIILAPQIIF